MAFPSVISSFTNPSASNKLNSPSHSSIETAQNTALTEIQTFIGTDSSIAGTLMYDVRAAASNGGGHVQTANKGGTGQTAYTKGDLLVATSASVLAKLAVGTDGFAPIADSTAQAGISWQGVLTAPAIQNQTYTYARASVISGSVYGITLGSNPSILSDGMGLVVKFPATNATSLIALQITAQGATSVTALIKKPDLSNFATNDITASTIGVLEFDSVSSIFQMVSNVGGAKAAGYTIPSVSGIVNFNSSATADLSITAPAGTKVAGGGAVVTVPGDQAVILSTSGPTSVLGGVVGSAWRVMARSTSGTSNATVTAYAICITQ